MAEQNRRDPRASTELRIRLALGSMDAFVERYALNVSRGGIFVRTRDPQPPGSVVDLEIALDNGEVVIRGKGVVRWTTPPSAPGEPDRQPGMGIKFVDLTRESRALVDLVAATRGADASSDEPPRPGDDDEAAEAEAEDEDAVEIDLDDAPAPAPPPVAAPAPPPPPRSAPPAASSPAPAGAAGAPRAGAPPPEKKPAAAEPRMGPVIGIDLGTTNSCAAFAREG